MKTQELIERFKANLPEDMMSDDHIWVNEITQRLLEYDELKKLCYDAIESLQYLFEFVATVTDDDMEGEPIGIEEDE